MSNHNHAKVGNAAGFTIVELLVVISLVTIIFISFASFFTNYTILYSKYQQDATNFTDLAAQSQRISNVMRGITDIITPADNSLLAYAYFSPVDAYVSQVKYYVSATGKSLMADVTPLDANPPSGVLQTAKKKTYTVIPNFYQPSGGKLFQYYDASNSVLTVPIADEHVITQIQVNLAVTGSRNVNGQSMTTTVSLRNRKTSI